MNPFRLFRLISMLTVLTIVAPVFALVATGFVAVKFGLYPRTGVHGLISFVNNFATPCLLFRAMLQVDFGSVFNPVLIAGFYTSALISFIIGIVLTRAVFANRPGESIASAFGAMFSNLVLLGIPIIQRAYGDDALQIMYTIVGLHAPTLISVGLIVMEISRRDGAGLGAVSLKAARRVVSNPLLIGIALGLIGNFSGLTLIEPADAFTRMMAQAVLPAALFGLGGALNEYRVRDNWVLSATMASIKLAIMPTMAWILLVPIFRVDHEIAKVAIVMSGMPTGINAYVFATSYKRSVDISASTILITTAMSVFSVSFWLYVMSF